MEKKVIALNVLNLKGKNTNVSMLHNGVYEIQEN